MLVFQNLQSFTADTVIFQYAHKDVTFLLSSDSTALIRVLIKSSWLLVLVVTAGTVASLLSKPTHLSVYSSQVVYLCTHAKLSDLSVPMPS